MFQSLSFSTVFYCGISIYKNIKSMTSMRSSLDQSLQSQLFYALVFQTLIPVILMHIPASFGFLVSIFGNSIQLFGQLPTFSIFLFPMLDPLPNFFIIRSYRQAITGNEKFYFQKFTYIFRIFRMHTVYDFQP